jgi:hypothetical protein
MVLSLQRETRSYTNGFPNIRLLWSQHQLCNCDNGKLMEKTVIKKLAMVIHVWCDHNNLMERDSNYKLAAAIDADWAQ